MAFNTVQIGKPQQADPLALVQEAYRAGASINRIDEWYHVSNSGKTEYEFCSLVPSPRPRWTARSGYQVERTDPWWVERTLGERIRSQP